MHNGHFGSTCNHLLLQFSQDGDVEPAMLRHGNVASDDNPQAVLLGVIERYRDADSPKYFRDDTAFAEKAVRWHENDPLLVQGEGQMENVSLE